MARVRQFEEDSAFEQALDIFGAKGFRATSMLDLAKSTGVQRGSLYNACGHKEEIFLRVFERYAERFIADARKALNKPDLRNALTDFLHSQSVRSRRARLRAAASRQKPPSRSTLNCREQELVMRMLDELEDVLLGVLDIPEARAQLIIPPRQAARVIVTMTRGIAVMERVYVDPKRLRQTALALVDTLVQQ
jgi:AcrR family transcriptional regulator